MSLSRSWNRAAFAVLALALVFVVGLAVRAAGFNGVDLELNDGSAWLMDRSDAAGGRVNGSVREVEIRLRVAERNEDFFIEQAPGAVLVHNRTAQTLTPIETATFSMGAPALLPSATSVQAGPSSALVYAAERGEVWRVPVSGRSLGSINEEQPHFEADGPVLAAMGRDGVVHIWHSTTGEVVRLTERGPEPAVQGARNVEAISVSGGTTLLLGPGQITLVGDGTRTLDLDRGLSFDVQQTSSDAEEIALVSEDGRVWRIDPLNETVVEAAAGIGGGLLPPVVLGDCIFTVSVDEARAVRQCGDEPAVTFPVEVRPGTPMRIMLVNDRVWIDVLDDQRALYLPEDGDPESIESWGDAVFAGEPEDGQGADGLGGNLVEGDSGIESSLLGVGEVTGQSSVFGGGPNVAPEARPDEKNARPGRSRVLRVLDNDFDANGDILLITDVESIAPEQGIVVMSADRRTLQFTPAGGFVGTVSFVYGISDGHGGTDRTTVTITVVADDTNSPPEPLDDIGTVRAGQEISISVLMNDDDPDGDALRLVNVEGTEGSIVVDDRLGIATITPPTDARGELVYTYTVADDRLANATAIITLEVIPVDGPNQRPIPEPDLYIVNKDDPLTVSVLANDTDLEGDTLLVTSVEAIVGDIELRLPADTGEASFPTDTPGTYVFVYEIVDDNGPGESLGVLRVEVTDNQQNLPPVAEADAPPALEPVDGGSTRVFNVLANDSDPNGDPLVVVSVSGVDPRLGLVESPDGNFILQPSTELAGQDVTFEYTITDGFENSTTTVTVRVVSPPAIDNPPIAEDDLATIRAGQSVLVDVLANDRDPEKLPLEIAPGSFDASPADGIRVLQEGQRLRVLADETASGSIEFRYAAIDKAQQTDSAIVRVDVLPPEVPNQTPEANNIDLSTFESEPVIARVLDSSFDPDGDPLSIADVSPALHGIVEIVAVPGQQSVVRYTPDDGYVGTDEFTYIVADPQNAQAGAKVRIVVQQTPELNNAPNAIDDVGFEVRVGRTISIPVLANDRDLDGDPLSIAKIGEAALGTAVVENGQISFTAPPDLVTNEPTSVSLQYWISDGNSIVEGRDDAYTAVVSITILPPEPKPPEPARDEYGPFKEGEVVSLNVLDNDVDPDGTREGLTIVSVDGGPAGLSIAADARSLDLLVGDEPFSFSYTVQDPDQEVGSASVTVNVIPNRPPLAGVDLAEVRQREDVELNVLANDVDVDDDPISLLTISDFRGGFAEIIDLDAGVVRFTPDDDVTQGGFSYRINDGPGGHEVTGTAQITVLPPANTEPIANAGTFDIPAGETQPYNLLQLTDDTETPNALDITSISGGNGQITAVNNGDGTVSITSAIDGRGATATIDYTVSDRGPGDPLSTSSTLQVTVIETRRPRPQAVADGPFETNQGQSINLDSLVGNDLPVDGNLLIVNASPTGGGGSVTVNGDGRGVTYDPDPEFFGTFGFTYTIEDETKQVDRRSTSGRIDVNVIGRPDAPSSISGSPSNGMVDLTWPTPANNGAPITYELEINGGSPIDVGNVNAYQATGLNNGTNYTFRVRSVNIAGPSDEWSPPSANLQPNALPDQPPPPVAIPGDMFIDLTWVTPDAQGSVVQGFQVERIGVPAVDFTGNSNQFGGLMNDQPYQFRVRARTDAQENDGWGEWSNLSISATPFGRPFAPPTPTASGEIQAVSLAWGETDNNGASISGYTVRRVDTGEPPRSANTGRSLTWTGIANGATPCFTVAAINQAGEGPESPQVCATVPDVPSPPTGVSASSSPEAATVTWNAAAPNGAGVTTYRVIPSVGSPVTTSALTANFSGLQNGNSYSFRVEALNAVGWSNLSAQSNTVTPIDVPDVSGPPTATNGQDASSTVSFSGAIDDQGSLIGSYNFRNENTNEVRSRATPSINWTGLSNGTTYRFRMESCNAAGCSGYSAVSNAITPVSPITAPSAPAGVSASAGYGTISFSWPAPANNGGETISCYNVRWFAEGNSPRMINCVTGRTYGEQVFDGIGLRQAQVQACNPTGGCSGFSPWSNTIRTRIRGTTNGRVGIYPTQDLSGSPFTFIDGTLDLACISSSNSYSTAGGFIGNAQISNETLPSIHQLPC